MLGAQVLIKKKGYQCSFYFRSIVHTCKAITRLFNGLHISLSGAIERQSLELIKRFKISIRFALRWAPGDDSTVVL